MTDSNPPSKEQGTLWRSKQSEEEGDAPDEVAPDKEAGGGDGQLNAKTKQAPPPPEEGYLQENVIRHSQHSAASEEPASSAEEAALPPSDEQPAGLIEPGDAPVEQDSVEAAPSTAKEHGDTEEVAASSQNEPAEPIAAAASDLMTNTLIEADVASRQATDDVIRLEGVSKAFNGHVVFEDLTLSLERRKVTAIIGPSGTGKSVLLKHIVGLVEPDTGEVYFEDRPIRHLSPAELVEVRMQIGFLFQMGALFDSMTVEQNITFPLVEHTRVPAAERRRRCREALKMVGLEGLEARMPGDLSGGQRKRVALARAIVLEPKVVLYDEPTTGLDPIRAGLINELIASLNERLGITSVVVTHDMASASRIADRIVMLYDGRIVADAEPERFMHLEHDMVQRFIRGEAEQAELAAIHRTGSSSRSPAVPGARSESS